MKIKLLCAILVLTVIGCKEDQEIKAITEENPIFKSIPPVESGLNFENRLRYEPDLNIIDYLYYYNGGGVAIGDINNDGLDDIYVTANQLPDKLFLNKGEMKFEDISAAAGIRTDSTWSSGVVFADLNNDGFLDIHVAKVGTLGEHTHNLVYLNQGGTSFTEVAEEIGLAFEGYSTQAAFLDYDRDGDLDMYLLNHSVHTPYSYGNTSRRTVKDSLAGDRFYENKMETGVLKFEDVSEAAGIYSSALGYGLGIHTADLNEDGFPDIYVSNDFHENDYLYLNTGRKSFTEESQSYFAHGSRFSMGMDVGDLNQDNLPDIFTLDMMPYDREIFLKSGGEDSDKVTKIKADFGFQPQLARNSFQLNQGTEHYFSDVALMTETYATDWSWSTLIQDFDNDGLNDIFITNGIYKRPNDLDYIRYLSNTDFAQYSQDQLSDIEQRLIDSMPEVKIANILFKNEGDLKFRRLTTEAGLCDSFSNGAAYGDLDNDGDLDLVINNINEPVTLLQNTTQEHNRHPYLQLTLNPDTEKLNAIGSAVTLYGRNGTLKQQLSPTRGFQSSSSHRLHFSLELAGMADSLQILWPDGKLQTVSEGELSGAVTIAYTPGLEQEILPLDSETNVMEFPYLHLENKYLDFVHEPLMPERLSVEGPAAVYADFNGDGLKDLYLGAARFQRPFYYTQNADGSFTKQNQKVFDLDEKYEDVDAAAFDLENDGDLDLYVVSGGSDAPNGDPQLEDRIYINDGKGNFKRLNAQLPATNGACIAVGDYNNDSYPDLFIGGRSLPGAYGLSPISMILKNTGTGKFELVAQNKLGMVSDAQWADLNADGFQDLIVAGDWIPITVLMNQKDGKFSARTQELGLQLTSGMWNTLEIADVNKDGKPDIIGGNAGENFKWKASPEKPVILYVDDFDRNEQPDPILFYPLFDNYVPFSSRDVLTGQLPYLAKRFQSYKSFSKITGIEDLTGKKEDEIALKMELKELRSMVYLNGENGFEGVPLPKMAQRSSIEDLFWDEQRGNLYYVGNYKGFSTELGPSDADAGGVLENFTDSGFTDRRSISVPPGSEGRKIIHLSENRFLFVPNNGKAYVFDTP